MPTSTQPTNEFVGCEDLTFDSFDNRRNTHAAADAERDERVARLATLKI